MNIKNFLKDLLEETMKSRKSVLTTLVMLFALAITPGCGSKDNEAGDSGNNTNPNNNTTVVNPIVIDGRETCRTDLVNFDDFKTAVSNGEFINQQYPIVVFYVQKMRKRGILWVSSTSSSRISYDNGNLTHEYGNSKEAVRDALMDKLNDSVSSRFLDSGHFQFEVSNGDQYEIDLCSPIAANPLKFYDKSANEYHNVSPYWNYYYY
jgi:hypothetical protein